MDDTDKKRVRPLPTTGGVRCEEGNNDGETQGGSPLRQNDHDGGSSTDNETQPNEGKVLENPLSKTPTTVDWVYETELGYTNPTQRPTVCFACGKQASPPTTKLSKCAKCSVAAYCSRDCQVSDWKTGRHKMACPSYARAYPAIQESNAKEMVRNELFSRIRFYACPYGVFRYSELGRGFLFLQTDKTLQDMSLYIPKDCTGRAMTRSVLIHYLTLGEFDSEVCRDDFELAMARTALKEQVESYDPEKEAVLLCRFRCGHLALGRAVLVPDFKICKKLGQDYYSAENAAGALQLNLDDL
mmetsp:Transcript_31813/g.53167  ORF Transcript_31813/g.53167 Transcript_31813/m.53167 type:complete len:299 (-) Transcript_31813:121-1017(-)